MSFSVTDGVDDRSSVERSGRGPISAIKKVLTEVNGLIICPNGECRQEW